MFANLETPVFIRGETGTGKKLTAKLIHTLSARNNAPLVHLDCADTEDFGRISMLFSSKTLNDKLSLASLHAAQGGTLFFRNINALPLSQQRKLLCVLRKESHFILNQETLNARIICSSFSQLEPQIPQLNRDLALFLNEYTISLPPLRDYKEDIPFLAEHFICLLNQQSDTNKNLTDKTLIALINYCWPENVSKLRNTLQEAYLLTKENHIPASLVMQRMKKNSGNTSECISITVGESIANTEKTLIMKTMEKTCGNKAAAARVLGISLKTLYNKLDLYTRNDRF